MVVVRPKSDSHVCVRLRSSSDLAKLIPGSASAHTVRDMSVRGGLPPDRLRIFCLAGDGVRGEPAYRPFYLGLLRSSPRDLLRRIEFPLRYSDHHPLFDTATAGRWAELPLSTPPSFTAPILKFDRCACCPSGASYDRYARIVRRYGGDDDFLRLGSQMLLQDVRRYLTNTTLRSKLARHAAQALAAARPDVVVAHSLGAIVAVEALALLASGDMPQASAQTFPRLLITAGAPFARQRFLRAWSPRARAWLKAPGLEWLNLVDMTDEVVGGALPPAEPYAAMRDVVVNNDHVVNRLFSVTESLFGAEAGPKSTHRIQHYLNHPPVAAVLTRASAGPFVSSTAGLVE